MKRNSHLNGFTGDNACKSELQLVRGINQYIASSERFTFTIAVARVDNESVHMISAKSRAAHIVWQSQRKTNKKKVRPNRYVIKSQSNKIKMNGSGRAKGTAHSSTYPFVAL